MIKRFLDTIRPHIRFLSIILLVVSLNAFVRLSFIPPTISGDAHGYIDTARLISGESEENLTLYPGRLLKPLTSLGILLFAPLYGGDMVAGLLTLNVLCYVLLAVATYALLLLFTTDRFLAMLVTIMFITMYPVLEYGLNLFSEMGSWLLFVLTIFGSVRYYREASWRNYHIALIAIIVGLLWKEYAAIAGVFFGLIMLAEPTRTWKEKFARIALLGVCSIATLGIMQWIVYVKFHYTYIDFIKEAASLDPSLSQHNLYFMAKSLFGVFLLGWGLVLLGAMRWRSIPRQQLLMLALLLPPSMICMFWKFVSSRLYFLFAPFLAILALHGLETLSGRKFVRTGVVIVIMTGSYAWLFLSGIARAFFQ